MRGVSSVHSRSSAASRLLLISIVQCRTICGGHMCLIIIRCSSMCTKCWISFSGTVCSMQCGRHGFQHFMFRFLEAWKPSAANRINLQFSLRETRLSGKYCAFCVSATVWSHQNPVCLWITFKQQFYLTQEMTRLEKNGSWLLSLHFPPKTTGGVSKVENNIFLSALKSQISQK